MLSRTQAELAAALCDALKYASDRYRDGLTAQGIECSMSPAKFEEEEEAKAKLAFAS
jgi:hypothetical protein